MSPLPTAPPHLSTQDARLRAAYLRELLDTLYPGDGSGDTEFLVLPTARRPRLRDRAARARCCRACVGACVTRPPASRVTASCSS